MMIAPPPLKKIVSGGQTGSDRAGLDAALKLGIPIGGYCPRGRKAEDGTIPLRYPLLETDSPDYAVRTRMNVRESDGTLVLNVGPLSGGTRVTVEYAAQRRKPCMLVQLDQKPLSIAKTADWLAVNGIRTLNIAGPRESKAPGTYARSLRFLAALLALLNRRRFRAERQSIIKLAQGLFPADILPRILLVGGVVRDLLTGRETHDLDLISTLPAASFEKLGFRRVEGTSGATIMFRHQPAIGKIEVTLVASDDSVEDDLHRRDFRCNSIAMALDGTIIDPLGGRRDLKKRCLHTCSEQAFFDDPIRIFRGFRFETDGWTMTTTVEQLIAALCWDERLVAIPVERFSNEMRKALAGTEPTRFFQRMLELQVGRQYLPELFSMADVPAGPVEHHPEGDLFTHSCQVLDRIAALTPDPLARFCALFHDLGKLATDPALHPKHHGHDEAGFGLASGFCDRLRLPARWRRALAWTNRLHDTANRWEKLRYATKIRMAEQAIKGGIEKILPLVSAADRPRSPVMPGWEAALAVARMTADELGIPPLQLQMMAPEKRGDFLLQKRIEELRKSR